jgi:hypothetical protein
LVDETRRADWKINKPVQKGELFVVQIMVGQYMFGTIRIYCTSMLTYRLLVAAVFAFASTAWERESGTKPRKPVNIDSDGTTYGR